MKTIQELKDKLRAACEDLHAPSLSTQRAYAKDVSRLSEGRTAIKSKNSHYRAKAATRWHFKNSASMLLNFLEVRKVHPSWLLDEELRIYGQLILDGIERSKPGSDQIDENVAEGRECDFAESVLRHSKREGIAELPADWREQMLKRVEAHPYQWIPLQILALTGLRRSELDRGVRLELDLLHEHLVIKIDGSKVTETRGQALRELHFALGESADVSRLIALLGLHAPGDAIEYRYPRGRLNDLVRECSDALFSEVVVRPSPVSFRHQFAADLKAAGEHPEQIAMLLGHRSMRTQAHYGKRRHGRKGGIKPCKAAATHPVRNRGHIVSGDLDAAIEFEPAAPKSRKSRAPGGGGVQ